MNKNDKIQLNNDGQLVDMDFKEVASVINSAINIDSYIESGKQMNFQRIIHNLKIKYLDQIPEELNIKLHYSDYLQILDDININLTVLRNYDIENAEAIIKTTIYDDLEFIFNRIKSTKLTDKMYPHHKPTKDGYIYLRKVDK